MAIPRILLCGIPSEPPLAMAASALDQLGIPYLMFNQRRFARMRCEFALTPAGIAGALEIDGKAYALDNIDAVYTRMTDYEMLPYLDGRGDQDQESCERLHKVLMQWYEIAPGRVVNRSRPSASNNSKPWQAQVIRRHFAVPETLVTNDPGAALAFLRHHGRVIYKSVSGTRSIVREFAPEDLEQLEKLPCCPVQFQQYIPGVDVRVHVIGGATLATAVESDGIDYRYAHREGHDARLTACAVPEETAAGAVALTRELGLEFSGIDLRVGDDGVTYCFEVNPSPAYSYYEEHTGQPIADTLARYLAWLD